MICSKRFYVSTLAPGIAKYLNENDMSINALANKAGMGQAQLFTIMTKRGISGMTVKTAIKLMKATGWSFEELFMNYRED